MLCRWKRIRNVKSSLRALKNIIQLIMKHETMANTKKIIEKRVAKILTGGESGPNQIRELMKLIERGFPIHINAEGEEFYASDLRNSDETLYFLDSDVDYRIEEASDISGVSEFKGLSGDSELFRTRLGAAKALVRLLNGEEINDVENGARSCKLIKLS